MPSVKRLLFCVAYNPTAVAFGVHASGHMLPAPQANVPMPPHQLLLKASCCSGVGGGGVDRCGVGATSRSCSTHSVRTCSAPSRPCSLL